jgi:N-acetylneuraminic acid mutarotase
MNLRQRLKWLELQKKFMLKSFSFLGLAIVCASTFVSCTKSSTSSDKIGNWTRVADFKGSPRSGAACAATDDSAYVSFGFDGINRVNDFFVFDLNKGQWLQRASIPAVGRNLGISFAVNGKVYAGFGYDGGTTYYKDFYVFDPAQNKWSQLKDFPGTGRYAALGFSINGKGYICSGNDGNALQELWEYNPADDSWTQKAAIPGYKRMGAVSFVINNIAYVVTGTNNGVYNNDMWSYDPTTDTWTEKKKITNVSDQSYDDTYTTITRAYAVAFVMNNKAELSTGSNGGLNSKTWEYDPTQDQWTEKTPFEGTAREQAVGFTLKNRGFVTTGKNATIQLDDTREFKPNDTDDTTDD